MVRLVGQYLAIYRNENLPNSQKIAKVCSKFFYKPSKPTLKIASNF